MIQRRSFFKILGAGVVAACIAPIVKAKAAAVLEPVPDVPCDIPKTMPVHGECYWQGCENVPPDWGDARNWSGGKVPSNGDNVYFGSGSICNGIDRNLDNLNSINISPDAERIGTF